MVTATATRQAAEPEPKFFPDDLELPLPLDHKTWETMRLCPPLLAVKVGCDRAVFIAQLHFRLETISNQRASGMVDYRIGICKHGYAWWWAGEYELWEENPFFSKETAGRFRREFEERGWIVTNNFHSNPFDRRKFQTLNYPLIAQETGYNPKLIELSRRYPTPPTFQKGKKSRTRRLDDDVALVYSQPYETYPLWEDFDTEDLKEGRENPNNSSQSLQPLISPDLAKTHNRCQETANIEIGSNLKSSIYIESPKFRLNTTQRKEKGEKDSREKTQESSDIKEIDKKINKSSTEQTKAVQKTNVSENFVNVEKKLEATSNLRTTNKTPNREKYDWEHEIGKPFPDLVRWRANTHYKTQGERWASSALSHAAAEIIRKTEENPEAVYWMWQDFLEYAEQSADNALAIDSVGMEPGLPNCFHNGTRDTATVGAKLDRAKGKVQAAQVARVEKTAALEAAKLAALPPSGETESERFWRQVKEKLEEFKVKYEAFKDKPRFLNFTIAFVKNTPGLIWTDENGPAIDPNYIFDESDEPLKDILPSSNRTKANPPAPEAKNDCDNEPDNNPPDAGGSGVLPAPVGGRPSSDGGVAAFPNQIAFVCSNSRTQPEAFSLPQDVEDPWGDVENVEGVEEPDGIDTATEDV
jgi:hypothetical protein